MDVETLMVHPDALKPETLVSGWRILGRSGKGGFGAVYRVEDAARPGEVYALKMSLRLGDPRAERETTLLMTKAMHTNIVRIHGHGRWPHPKEGYHYIVMDHVEGPNLIDWVEGTNPSFHQLGAVLDKLALALGFLNEHDAWHRDVKPENILVRSSDGEPILLDLSAGDYEGAQTLTEQPLPPGTRHCRSPEALRFNQRNWDRKGVHYEYKATDELYALGVTAYRALTGHWPFPLELPREVLEDVILWRVPPSPETVNRRVPPELSALVMRLLDKDPEARPQSGRELHEAVVAASAFGEAAVWEATCFEWENEPDGLQRRIRRPEPPTLLPGPKPPAPPKSVPFALATVPAPGGALHAQDAPALDPSFARDGIARERAPSRAVPVPARAWRRWVLRLGLILLLGGGLALGVVYFSPTLQVGLPSFAKTTHEVANSPESPDAREAAVPPSAEATPAVVATPATGSEEPTPVKTKKATGNKSATQRKSKNLEKAAAAVACLELSAGCASTQVKPFEEVEKCPPEALAAMKKLGLRLGSAGNLVVDVQQPGTSGDTGRYQDGPITSVLLGEPTATLPAGSLILGTLWTSSGRIDRWGDAKVYGRYTEVRTPNGQRYPVCFTLGDEDGVPQLEGSQPGAALLPRSVPFKIVKRYIFE
ncbi:serine/threonine protein kinase [Hyalangium rubrum]|uniref:non-specific serine/threonine protein kinase n=1 Tax=Hyalangium rubrum TaxID=3103134 RepID=A0ABU5HD72_9BACT|nr:serine/threonine-protein kinase [Hyalangium sp. s54d21]MDY7231408.1 serine/threonine-protein kinase [Hyalangium sp. s54d21]